MRLEGEVEGLEGGQVGVEEREDSKSLCLCADTVPCKLSATKECWLHYHDASSPLWIFILRASEGSLLCSFPLLDPLISQEVTSRRGWGVGVVLKTETDNLEPTILLKHTPNNKENNDIEIAAFYLVGKLHSIMTVKLCLTLSRVQ